MATDEKMFVITIKFEVTGNCIFLCRFLQVLDAAALDFQLNRLNMYTMAHTFKDYRFLERVVRSNSTYLLQRKVDGHFKFITMAAKL